MRTGTQITLAIIFELVKDRELRFYYGKPNKNATQSNPGPPNEPPEKEGYQIELRKDNNRLGITIAGYVCEKG